MTWSIRGRPLSKPRSGLTIVKKSEGHYFVKEVPEWYIIKIAPHWRVYNNSRHHSSHPDKVSALRALEKALASKIAQIHQQEFDARQAAREMAALTTAQKKASHVPGKRGRPLGSKNKKKPTWEDLYGRGAF